MKINQDDQFGLMFRKEVRYRNGLKKMHFQHISGLSQSEQIIHNYTINYFLSDTIFNDFYISETVREIATKVKIGDDFDYKLLSVVTTLKEC
jgi:hypothetical protein